MKFTKPREANRLLMSQTGQFQRIISQMLRAIGEVSRLVTSAIFLLQSNRSLFLVMLVTTPATIIANEAFDRLSHYLQIQMIETEQYEFNELISTLESRTAFTASRFAGREAVNVERFDSAVTRLESHRLKQQALRQVFTPLNSTLTQLATLIAYWKGGQQVLNKTFPAGDLVAFVAESNATISTMWTDPQSPIVKGGRVYLRVYPWCYSVLRESRVRF